MTQPDLRQTWLAMKKFANDKQLTEQEWADLSQLTLLDRNNLYFGPENVRLASSDVERADNLKFYQSLSPAVH
jgi:hypothetical protein